MKPSCILTALCSSSVCFGGYPTKNTFKGKTDKFNMKDHYAGASRTRLIEVRGEVSHEV